MRALVVVAVVVAAGAAGGGCARPHLGAAAARAAADSGVPERIVLAMAYAESRGQAIVTEDGARQWVRLVPWRGGRNLAAAAAALGVSEARVRRDPELALRGAATLLARTLGAPSPSAAAAAAASSSSLQAWRAALERFNGGRDPLGDALYADEVLGFAAGGFGGTADDGRAFGLPAAGAPPPSPPQAAWPPRPPSLVGAAFARFVPASAAASRPRIEPIRYIVLHTTENMFPVTVEYFRRPTTAVAAHYLVRASDGLVVQLVDERRAAFHDACFNDGSIGIEHEGYVAAGRRWYSDAMYRASARLVRDVAARNGIPLDRRHILGHGETPDCSDHVDPGPDWDWDRFMRLVTSAGG